MERARCKKCGYDVCDGCLECFYEACSEYATSIVALCPQYELLDEQKLEDE